VDVDTIAALVARGTVPLVRTYFGNDAIWDRLVRILREPVDALHRGAAEGVPPNLAPISDAVNQGATGPDLGAAWLAGAHPMGYVALADAAAMEGALSPSLVFVDLTREHGREFRCAAGQVAEVEANLSLSNLDFSDFADYAARSSEQQMFRGFAR
jgi:hypothetical protein